MPEQAVAERQVTMAEAIREALAEEMRRDPRVFVMGEDVAEAGTPFKVLRGLVDEFGPERVMDTPISEPGFTGIGLGAAMTGMRPVVDIMFGDFLFLALDQIGNQAAKVHYMSGGRLTAPIVIRTTLGATRRSAAQHSQSLHAVVSHIPGLKVALPSTPYDAKGLMKTAIRDDNPVVIFEDKMMYAVKGIVPEGDYTIPFGKADVKRAGDDITLIATSSMVYVALAAADKLAAQGISAEVIDPRTTVPLDVDTLVASAMKTGRAIVIDEGYQSYGVTGEIASLISDRAFYQLDAPVKRMGAMDVPIPFSPALEDLTVPTAEKVAELATILCRKGS
ncbi:MAG: alpha-ketoacid dehydrogenase subunit beta [Chloroflexi bacterium]|nr:MAG: alpha-ketoacid dehydrogenase subunit beta [Chloroflexota bacterium]